MLGMLSAAALFALPAHKVPAAVRTVRCVQHSPADALSAVGAFAVAEVHYKKHRKRRKRGKRAVHCKGSTSAEYAHNTGRYADVDERPQQLFGSL